MIFVSIAILLCCYANLAFKGTYKLINGKKGLVHTVFYKRHEEKGGACPKENSPSFVKKKVRLLATYVKKEGETRTKRTSNTSKYSL